MNACAEHSSEKFGCTFLNESAFVEAREGRGRVGEPTGRRRAEATGRQREGDGKGGEGGGKAREAAGRRWEGVGRRIRPGDADGKATGSLVNEGTLLPRTAAA